MAAVSVFVDDAVRGRLPLVCARTGEPTDTMIRMSRPVGGGLAGMAWLLVFFGPPGWVALVLVMALGPRQEYLTVRIPQTNAAYRRETTRRRSRLAVLTAGVLLLLCGVVSLGPFPMLWWAAGAAFLVAAAILHGTVLAESINISLDASRRWVTLSGVHPEFVRAVEDQEAATGRR